jgi:6-phosphogluconate dehydrogenase (decarboxylating)
MSSPKKKNTRQKKILQMVEAKDHVTHQGDKNYEEAIRRQMDLIKKDYNKLVTDVAGGFGLIKNWVGVQAVSKSEMIKSRFAKI